MTAPRVYRTWLGMRLGRAGSGGVGRTPGCALVIALAFAWLSPGSSSQAADDPPNAPSTGAGALLGTPLARVKTAVNAVVSILREKGGSRESRWNRISAVIGENFDFQGMSRRVLATEWRRATPEERRQFSDYFSQYIETTFRSQIEAYTDQRIEYLSERVRGDRATVETVLVSGEVRTPVTYKLRRSADGARRGQWLAYDVVIEGVSLVANYRNTFAAIAKTEGMDGLIADVQRRIDRHRRSKRKANPAN